MEQHAKTSARFKKLWIRLLLGGIALFLVSAILRGFVSGGYEIFSVPMIIGAVAAAIGLLTMFLWIAALIAGIAVAKGRTWAPFFVLSLFFPLVMWIVVSVITTDQATATTGTKTCPFCAERIKDQAIVCRFCGREVQADTPVVVKQISPKAERQATIKLDQQDAPNVARRLKFAAFLHVIFSSAKGIRWSRILRKRNLVIAAVLILGVGIAAGATKYNDVQNQNKIAEEQKAAKEALATKRALEDARQREREARLENDMSWVPSGYTKFEVNPYFAWKKDGRSCNSGGTCLPITVVGNKYCSTLWVRGSLEQFGEVTESASDTAVAIFPGDRKQLKLTFASDEPGNVDFTHATCR